MALDIQQVMTTSPVIPVLVIQKLEDAVPLARALYMGGLKVLEITLRTECALAAITAIKKQLPEAIVGAGTVVDGETLKAAEKAGAEFFVSPGTNESLLGAAKETDIPLLPGVSTPSEAMRLYEQGYTALKFFPAEAAGGTPMLKSIAGPLPQLTFCPTGGINPQNAPDYLALANVRCIGGSWMAPAKLVAEQNWQIIENMAREAAGLSMHS
jgi:2-dehydro-3-deoxyphosphogluconate aldolase/(4S)-4-hydroxy-2-oxoglutarate aldolase